MHFEPQILVIRQLALGDVILTTPIVEQIYRDHQGHCSIDVLTMKPEVFANNPCVRKVYTPETYKEIRFSYDKTINLDLAYEKQPLHHITDAYAMYALGSPDKLQRKQPMLYSSDTDKLKAHWYKTALIKDDYVVLHMRQDKWPSRNLSMDFWRQVVDTLLNKTRLKIIQVGASQEFAFDHDARLLDLRDQLSIHELKELIAQAQLYVGIDSGTFHIAATTDTPIISLFTSAHHALRMPLGRPAHATFIAITPHVACYGCQSRATPPITGVICDQGDPFNPPCRHAFKISDIEDALAQLDLAHDSATQPQTLPPVIQTVDQLINLALFWATQSYVHEAIEVLDKIISVHPHYAKAYIERGFLKLKLGQYREAETDLEYIYQGRVPSQIGIFANENGELKDLKGQKIVLSSDAGIGDLLQLVRYGKLLKQQGATVVLECDKAFHTLLSGCEWIDLVAETAHIPRDFTHRVPLHHLIGAFHTTAQTIPRLSNYIHPTKQAVEKWKKVFKPTNKKRIGISWRSANEGTSSWTSFRAIELPALLKAFDPAQHELVCLQKILTDEERALITQSPHMVLNEAIFQDINETAAAIQSLDMVVSTCTMLPHLSGSMGVPTYVLLSTNSCWRWMMSGETTDWYECMKLLRQTQLNAWEPVVQQLQQELNESCLIEVA